MITYKIIPACNTALNFWFARICATVSAESLVWPEKLIYGRGRERGRGELFREPHLIFIKKLKKKSSEILERNSSGKFLRNIP